MAQTLAHQAYDLLRQRMFTGNIPVGMRLSDNDLSRDLGMSRTPVRKAILRLQEDGVVEKHPNGGFRVCQPTAEEFIQVFEERMAIEPQAARLAAQRISPEQLATLDNYCAQVQRIADLFHELELDRLDGSLARRLNELDARFHLTILQAAKSPGLLEMAARQRLFSRVFGYLQFPRRTDPDRIVGGHIQHWHTRIADALRQGDGELAAQLMHQHMQDAIESQQTQTQHEQQQDPNDWPSQFTKQIADMENQYIHDPTIS